MDHPAADEGEGVTFARDKDVVEDLLNHLRSKELEIKKLETLLHNEQERSKQEVTVIREQHQQETESMRFEIKSLQLKLLSSQTELDLSRNHEIQVERERELLADARDKVRRKEKQVGEIEDEMYMRQFRTARTMNKEYEKIHQFYNPQSTSMGKNTKKTANPPFIRQGAAFFSAIRGLSPDRKSEARSHELEAKLQDMESLNAKLRAENKTMSGLVEEQAKEVSLLRKKISRMDPVNLAVGPTVTRSALRGLFPSQSKDPQTVAKEHREKISTISTKPTRSYYKPWLSQEPALPPSSKKQSLARPESAPLARPRPTSASKPVSKVHSAVMQETFEALHGEDEEGKRLISRLISALDA